MVFEDEIVPGIDEPGDYEPCFVKAGEEEGWGVIAEEGQWVGRRRRLNSRPLRRVTRAQWVDIELWEKVWLEDQIRGWV